jgi:ribulose kinase
MDHRAIDDARAIDATGHPVLQFVGGSISPEMETPKLRWLRRNRPDTWRRTAHWFDLADYLTWRTTGSIDRSLCTTVCKWTYLGHTQGGGWSADSRMRLKSVSIFSISFLLTWRSFSRNARAYRRSNRGTRGGRKNHP